MLRDHEMDVSDPISDFLTCVRNAIRARHRKVDVPSSRMKAELPKVLLRGATFSNFIHSDRDDKQASSASTSSTTRDERNVIGGLLR